VVDRWHCPEHGVPWLAGGMAEPGSLRYFVWKHWIFEHIATERRVELEIAYDSALYWEYPADFLAYFEQVLATEQHTFELAADHLPIVKYPPDRCFGPPTEFEADRDNWRIRCAREQRINA